MTDGAPPAPARSGRGRLLLVLALLLVVGAVLWFGFLGGSLGSSGGNDDAAVEQGLAPSDDIQLTGVQLTSIEDGIDPATGLPTTERDSYDPGEGARLWVQFTYTGDDPGQDAVFVRWYREGEEIFQSSWRLPQPVENHNVALGASYTEEPGNYRVEVLLNDEVLHTVNFDVG